MMDLPVSNNNTRSFTKPTRNDKGEAIELNREGQTVKYEGMCHICEMEM